MKIINVTIFEGGQPVPRTHILETEEKAKAFLVRTVPGFDLKSFITGTFINTQTGMLRIDEGSAEGDVPFEQ